MSETIRRTSAAAALGVALGLAIPATGLRAADYKVDPAHSFVQFRIDHLGMSWLYGRFNKVSGTFSHDPANPDAGSISVEIETASVDTNHAERDKRLRSDDFLDARKFPEATFESTRYTGTAEKGTLEGVLTLRGVTRPVTIQVTKLGEGKDPWGGYRAGFIGTTTLRQSDFGIDYELGPKAKTMEMELSIEGVRR